MTLENLVEGEPADLTLQPSYKSVKLFVQDLSKQVVQQNKEMQVVAQFSKMHHANLKGEVGKNYETWQGYARDNVDLLLDLYHDFQRDESVSKGGDYEGKPHPFPSESGVPQKHDEWKEYQCRLGSMELTVQSIFQDIGVDADDYNNRRFDVKIHDGQITGVIK